jgi:hypothetical protein
MQIKTEEEVRRLARYVRTVVLDHEGRLLAKAIRTQTGQWTRNEEGPRSEKPAEAEPWLPPPSSPFKIVARRDDRYASERIKNQQVVVASHDKVGRAVHSQFKKLVVGWIAAGVNRVDDGDYFGDAP